MITQHCLMLYKPGNFVTGFFLQECVPKMWRSVVVQKGNTLLIQEVQEEDGGNYTCELKFEGKLIRRTVELKVTGKNLFSVPIGKKLKLWNNEKKWYSHVGEICQRICLTEISPKQIPVSEQSQTQGNLYQGLLKFHRRVLFPLALYKTWKCSIFLSFPLIYDDQLF